MKTDEEKPRKKRLRVSYSLRTMFVVVTIFGVWLGWQHQIVRERKAILAELENSERLKRRYFYYGLETLEAQPNSKSRIKDICRVVDYEYARISRVRRFLGDESCLMISFRAMPDAKLTERIELAFPEAILIREDLRDSQDDKWRDSMYKPAAFRNKNRGHLFKTGLFDDSK